MEKAGIFGINNSIDFEAFKDFRAARYEVVLEAGEAGLLLPAYKGSTLRGGFGSVFRRIVCSQKQHEKCGECLLKETCPFAYIFETSPPSGSAVLRNYTSVPRPFIFEPPLETKKVYLPGECLTFGLVLVGRAIEYLPYFIVSLKELGAVGIGVGRRSYNLHEIRAVDLSEQQQVVYRGDDGTVCNADAAVCGGDIKNWAEAQLNRSKLRSPQLSRPKLSKVKLSRPKFSRPKLRGPFSLHKILPATPFTEPLITSLATPLATQHYEPVRVTIHLQTVTRMKYNGSFVYSLPFHVFIRGLLRRISSLMYFHHDCEWKADFSALIKQAEKIKTVQENTRWLDWQRYSSRQNGKINLGGLVGSITYEGDLGVFMPLLKLGELVHVGKGTVFGMGKYELEL